MIKLKELESKLYINFRNFCKKNINNFDFYKRIEDYSSPETYEAIKIYQNKLINKILKNENNKHLYNYAYAYFSRFENKILNCIKYNDRFDWRPQLIKNSNYWAMSGILSDKTKERIFLLKNAINKLKEIKNNKFINKRFNTIKTIVNKIKLKQSNKTTFRLFFIDSFKNKKSRYTQVFNRFYKFYRIKFINRLNDRINYNKFLLNEYLPEKESQLNFFKTAIKKYSDFMYKLDKTKLNLHRIKLIENHLIDLKPRPTIFKKIAMFLSCFFLKI